MPKKYIVRLTDSERVALTAVVKKLKGSSQKLRRAQILLKADAGGPAWTDAKIAEAVGCRTKTVEDIRDNFDKIRDEDGYLVPANLTEELQATLKALGG